MPVLAASSMPTSVTEMPRPPRRRAEQPRSERVEQLLGNPCPFERHPHEHEQRHGDERLVAHDAEYRFGKLPGKQGVESAGQCHRTQTISAVPPSVKATGKPASSTAITVKQQQCDPLHVSGPFE